MSRNVSSLQGRNGMAFTSVVPDSSGHYHIYAQLPRSFGDEPRLQALGEELLHTLGATHE